jgi:cupin fold WbuC family metalloprotein
MNFIKESDEVYRTHGKLTKVSGDDVVFLKAQAAKNERRRVRLCAHPDNADLLHEMLIIHVQNTYVAPHKHVNKSESFHIIEGALNVFLFDDDGRVIETIRMGEITSSRVFYYRLSSSVYHSVLPESEFVVFHEVTNGPFDRNDTVVAPWAPKADDENAQLKFVQFLLNNIKGDTNDRFIE